MVIEAACLDQTASLESRVYLLLAVWLGDGLASLVTPLSSAFFTSGDDPGLPGVGEPVGDVDGLGDGCAVAVGAGVEAGLTGSGGLLPQAPRMATLAASSVEINNDLLIVFTSYFLPMIDGPVKTRTHAVRS
jgi:hypothetical protein